MSNFATRLIAWQRRHGRHGLPWQGCRDPYRVWLAEVMLQQTQVATARGYYERFLSRFPDLESLASAELGDVLTLWSGLGYYARARNLHACARKLMQAHGGVFPASAAALARLPGIGRSTAAAIAAFCFDERAPILDGNVRRVLARHFGIEGFPGQAAVERQLWALAQTLLPARAADMGRYTQALMDLGATCCTRSAPRCAECPLRSRCVARRTGRTSELPTPAPARAVARRRAHWLLVVGGEAVLLESRPPKGLWGGLLALPSFASARALERAAQPFAAGQPLRRWPARRHAFTHFTLEFTPHWVEAAAMPACEPGWQWLPLAALERAPLPTPVRTLLLELRDRREPMAPASPRRQARAGQRRATSAPRAASGSG